MQLFLGVFRIGRRFDSPQQLYGMAVLALLLDQHGLSVTNSRVLFALSGYITAAKVDVSIDLESLPSPQGLISRIRKSRK